MKPFNLEEALAGKPVVTRDGREVTQVTKFNIDKHEQPLIGVVDGHLESFGLDGSYYGDGEYMEYLQKMEYLQEMDLFMKTEKKTYWVNVYRVDKWNIDLSSTWDSEEEARRMISKGENKYLKTISFEIEE